jgi:hypothetical protein
MQGRLKPTKKNVEVKTNPCEDRFLASALPLDCIL